MQNNSDEQKQEEFPAYKVNPILIQGFLPKVTIMQSKEKPKKISMLGNDQRTYDFLLKFDK